MTDNRDIGLPFVKMHGLGNDFVVLDGRERLGEVTPDIVRRLADRRTGVGFDQLALIQGYAGHGGCDASLLFWNADGSSSATCGNATRCIARLLMEEGEGRGSVRLHTDAGELHAEDAGDGLTAVNMGAPGLAWSDVPLSREMDTLSLPIDGDPCATGMGNPHCTFFVESAEAVALEEFGPRHERHELFPQRANIQVASVSGPNCLRVRVWERGAGVTPASGSSSCAVAVAAIRRGLADGPVRIDLDGGSLEIEWRDDGVWATGPTARVFDGVVPDAWLEAQR